MPSKLPNKIHIIGSVGSGKTTLARTLSSELQIPYYELDNVVWRRSEKGDIRNTPEARDEKLNNIVSSNAWIVEGAHHTWVSQSFQHADTIIFLDVTLSKRIYRITKRYILQLLRLEKANYKPSFNMFLKMFKWTRDFERESKAGILHMLREHGYKLVILKDNREANIYKLKKTT
ncbi:AAA family ATPase [Bacillus cereus group sp. BfR-BA-01380]|uniref:AAA family ATPase n=1 Tax=Bacillus cereus group sp. BfR-BA-01380 TaxID=2920324 RepID=UPI001F55CFCE|nr:DNA topology modulation protein FlaR [Bacillus cereus group sp. BfR-BA-01380]